MEHKEDGGLKNDVGVSVITPIGVFPSESDFRRISSDEPVEKLLKLAAEALKLTNTSDWVAKVGERKLEVAQSFKSLGLHCLIEIEWHKGEGGGGA